MAPFKPAKVTLFTMICTIRKTFAILDLRAVHCFVTAVLWSILRLSYTSEPSLSNITKIPRLQPSWLDPPLVLREIFPTGFFHILLKYFLL